MDRPAALALNVDARHPLRRALPPPPAVRTRADREDKDLKLFVLSFTAFFIAIYSFIM